MSVRFFRKFIAMNSFVDFSSVNGEPSGGSNSQPDLIAPNVGNHNLDVLTNHNRLILASAQDQHLRLLLPFAGQRSCYFFAGRKYPTVQPISVSLFQSQLFTAAHVFSQVRQPRVLAGWQTRLRRRREEIKC
jgi:hypothetical protein